MSARELVVLGTASQAPTRICVTRFHGDHCLGLPGVLQRLSLDQVAHPVDVWYPAAGQEFFDRLRRRPGGVVLTHCSQRYPDDAEFAAEAGEIFPDLVVARDLDRVVVPPRTG